jgi:hypothetical protein
MPEKPPVFFDFEASGPEGVPIEVGWAYADDALQRVVSEAHLIRPDPDWDIEGCWDQDAERVHGIRLDTVLKSGRPVFEVARRLSGALAGRVLFSDSGFDEAWLDQLFEAAGTDRTFEVRRTSPDVLIEQLAAQAGLPSSDYLQLVIESDRNEPIKHRAKDDARHRAFLWLSVVQQIEKTG